MSVQITNMLANFAYNATFPCEQVPRRHMIHAQQQREEVKWEVYMTLCKGTKLGRMEELWRIEFRLEVFTINEKTDDFNEMVAMIIPFVW